MPFSLTMNADEARLTSFVGQALDGYIGFEEYGRSTPVHAVNQDLSKITDQEAFFDLVKRVSEYSVIALEIKVANHYKGVVRPKNFNKKQNRILRSLRSAGIPVWYCYNMKPVLIFSKAKNEDVLSGNNVSEPSQIIDEITRLIKHDDHITLKELVDDLMNGGGDIDRAENTKFNAKLMFSDAFDIPSRTMGARFLLILYNANLSGIEREVLLLDQTSIKQIRELSKKYFESKTSMPVAENVVQDVLNLRMSMFVNSFQMEFDSKFGLSNVRDKAIDEMKMSFQQDKIFKLNEGFDYFKDGSREKRQNPNNGYRCSHLIKEKIVASIVRVNNHRTAEARIELSEDGARKSITVIEAAKRGVVSALKIGGKVGYVGGKAVLKGTFWIIKGGFLIISEVAGALIEQGERERRAAETEAALRQKAFMEEQQKRNASSRPNIRM